MAHSYSAVKLYEQCPARYKFNRIDRLPEPSGPAAERGTMIHSEIEEAIKGGLGLLSQEVIYLSPKISEWKDLKAASELKFAIDSDWNPVEYTSDTAMFRGIIDLYVEKDDVSTVLDFKTGKDRDYSDQVMVYASVILASKPHIQTVKLVIEFIDLKKSTEYAAVTRQQLNEMKVSLVDRLNTLKGDKIFAPNPSFLCKWCHYRKDNGGPCKW